MLYFFWYNFREMVGYVEELKSMPKFFGEASSQKNGDLLLITTMGNEFKSLYRIRKFQN